MTVIIFFMIVALFAYTYALKHYHLTRCPRCHSKKITIDHFKDYDLFLCKTCKFSYRDYFSFYNLTPINDQLEIDFVEYDDEDIDQ